MSLRGLARICVALFALSTTFPVVAGLLPAGRAPSWLGIADVAVAAVLFGFAATVATRARSVIADRHRLAALRISQVVLGVIPALLASYFLVGSRVNWAVLIIGLGWRGWLLLYTLPFLVAAQSAHAPTEVDPGRHERSAGST